MAWAICGKHVRQVILETSRVGEGWLSVQYWSLFVAEDPTSLREYGVPYISKRLSKSKNSPGWNFYLMFPKSQGNTVLEVPLCKVTTDSIFLRTEEEALARCKSVSDEVSAIWRAFHGKDAPEFLEIKPCNNH